MRANELFAAIDAAAGASTDDPIPEHGEAAPDAARIVGHEAVQGVEFDYDMLIRDFEGDRGLVGGLLDLMLDGAATQLAAMRAAITRREPRALEVEAHTLKGAAGSLRAYRVAAIARRLEAIGRADSLDGAATLVDELDAAIASVSSLTAQVQRDPV
jgi:HPt (histidine-containing phosphotransfer) domain-containing protein